MAMPGGAAGLIVYHSRATSAMPKLQTLVHLPDDILAVPSSLHAKMVSSLLPVLPTLLLASAALLHCTDMYCVSQMDCGSCAPSQTVDILSQLIASRYFHAYRIDHILGFFRIWEIPGDCTVGLLGHFRPSIPLSRSELESRGIWDFNRWEILLPALLAMRASQKQEYSAIMRLRSQLGQLLPTTHALTPVQHHPLLSQAVRAIHHICSH